MFLESVNYVKNLKQHRRKFGGIIMQVGLTSRYRILFVDVTIRWNSTYLIFEFVIALRAALSSLEKQDKNYTFAHLIDE
jgi:hypothetical protein